MRKRVLIAEANLAARGCLEEVAAKLGADSQTAGDDELAYKKFLEFGPDFVFVDALLPRRGAFDLIRRIRQTEGGDQVGVYLLSALLGGDLKDEAIRVWGAKGFIVKPLQEEKLLQELRPILAIAQTDAPRSAPAPAAALDQPQPPPLEGDFDRKDLPLLITRFSRGDSSVVVLGSGKARKAVYFKDGRITFTRSNLFSETLARHLLDHGDVNEEQYRAAIADVLETGRRIGAAFVAMGAVDPERVAEAVRENIWEKLLNLATWRRGWYKVGGYAEPPAELPGGPIDVREFLWKVTRSEMSMTQVAEALRPLAERKLLPAGNPDELAGLSFLRETGKGLAELARRVSGSRVDEACETAGAKRLGDLYFLVVCGILRVEGGTEASQADLGLRTRAEAIVKRLSWMRGRNCFQILGVGLDSSDEEVRRAYNALRSELDPGRLDPELPAEARRAAHEAADAASRAFEALSSREKREIYIDSLRHGGEIPMNPAERQLRAEASYREGLMALKRGRLDEAIDRLGWAADLNPDEPDYLVQLAMARMKRETGDRGRDLISAEAALRRALEAAPQNAEPLYQMGRLQILRKKPQEAVSWMERALQCDPRHSAAALELKRLRKSGLGRLFGKRS